MNKQEENKEKKIQEKVCSCCGVKLSSETVKWIGTQEAKTFDLELFNCLKCNSTGAIKFEKKVL